MDQIPRSTHNDMLDAPKSERGKFHVKEMFSTVQGEGDFCGVKALFVRFTGCNLACTFCDTDFTYKYSYTFDELVDKIINWRDKELPEGRFNLIVLTGGEPLLQVNTPLIEMLILAGFQVQVETNGTVSMPKDLISLDCHLLSNLFVTCSPKKAVINLRLQPWIKELKIVLFDEDHVNAILDKYYDLFNKNGVNVYIQPCERDGVMDIKGVFNYIMNRKEVLKMSVQTQKLANFE